MSVVSNGTCGMGCGMWIMGWGCEMGGCRGRMSFVFLFWVQRRCDDVSLSLFLMISDIREEPASMEAEK